MKRIKVTQIKDRVNDSEWTVVYCYSKECKACKAFTPVLEQHLKVLNNNDIVFYKLNLSDKKQNAKELESFANIIQLDSIPFSSVFHKGKFIGADNLNSLENIDKLYAMVADYKRRHDVEANQEA